MRDLSIEEVRIWKKVSATVRPLDRRGPAETKPAEDQTTSRLLAPQVPVSGQTQVRAGPAAAISLPADRSQDRRVRRGRLAIAGTLDLHGHSQASALEALTRFVSGKQRDGARCVLIITGKGRDGEGVLRRNFLFWLETPGARSLISGYAQAHARRGGAGAFYLFLKSAKPGKPG